MMRAPANRTAHEAGVLEDADVFRGGGKRHVEGLDQLADGAFAGREAAQHLAPGGVGKRMEDGVELPLTFNHSVER